MFNIRFRNVYICLGFFLVLALSLLTDPDTGIIHQLPFGAGTLATLVILLKAVLYTSFLHITRKGLMDYLDMEELITKAKESSQGSGLALVGVGLYTIAMAIVIYAATV
jgi:uncharacterized membrane protein (DUF106 family)